MRSTAHGTPALDRVLAHSLAGLSAVRVAAGRLGCFIVCGGPKRSDLRALLLGGTLVVRKKDVSLLAAFIDRLEVGFLALSLQALARLARQILGRLLTSTASEGDGREAEQRDPDLAYCATPLSKAPSVPDAVARKPTCTCISPRADSSTWTDQTARCRQRWTFPSVRWGRASQPAT